MSYDLPPKPPGIEYRQGTPQSLAEALVQGWGKACQWLLEGASNPKAAAALEPVVRDYLAQKFATAMLKAKTPEESDRLEQLWFNITGMRVGALQNGSPEVTTPQGETE